ncbi:MAG: hypothetical protein AB1405_15865 [Bdellovibrionota bacterium]
MDFPTPQSPEEYEPLLRTLDALPPDEQRSLWRAYAISDLYFLLRFVLKRRDLWEPTSNAPPPLGEGAAEQRERALSRPAATLSQGERGIDEISLKGPAP